VTILISTSNQHPVHIHPALWIMGAALALLVAAPHYSVAQAPVANQPVTEVAASNIHFEIPDSPGSVLVGTSSSVDDTISAMDPNGADSDPTPAQTAKHSAHLQMTVLPGEIADPMSVHDKVVGGLKDSVSLFSVVGWLGAAGWEQLTNGSPNFGTDSGAFGQRLGAAALRAGSEGIFSDCLFAPIFHEDPRYYIMGKGHPFLKRLVYAGTRVLITRTDSGHQTPNFALIAGNAAGSALTIPYYPAKNTTFSEVAQTFGGSLGGSAIGFVVDEFIIDAMVKLHLKKQQQP
jgi:hypothetical protein